MSTKQAPSKNLMDDHRNKINYSTCPSGEKFPLPKDDDYANEFKKMQKLFKTILIGYTLICRKTSQKIFQASRKENGLFLMHLERNV